MIKNQQEFAKINDLTFSPWNPNSVDPINQQKLVNSIKEMGMYKPVIIRTLEDDTLQVIGGEHRVAAIKSMGEEQVWVINLGKISDERAKKIAITDNQHYGEIDAKAFAELVGDGDLGDTEAILSWMAIDEEEILNIFDHSLDEFDDIEMEFDDQPESVDIEPDVPPISNKFQIMRFKVSAEDAHIVTDQINRVKAEQGYKESDELTNAGDALIHYFKENANADD